MSIYIEKSIYVEKSGILISDVSDHLPIFLICKHNVKYKNCKNKFMYKRQLDDDSMAKIC